MIDKAWLILSGAILSVAGPIFASDISEKGKNQATREDVQEITKLVESVKQENAKDLEQLKTALLHRINRNKFRYEKEFEILAVLAATTIDLRDATTLLRPTVDFRRIFQKWNKKSCVMGRGRRRALSSTTPQSLGRADV
jgi:hypothetical protein